MANAFSGLAVLACALVLIIAPSCAPAAVVEYDFVIRREPLSPDGVAKAGLTINGQSPGPEIRVHAGDELVVRVMNDNVAEGTALHWHGQHLRNGDLYDDGVPFVTQCSILMGETYTYRYTVNQQPGTYFYHGHQGAQRGDGLAGPFIIEPAVGAPDAVLPEWDVEYNVMLQDWYHAEGGDITAGLNSIPFKWAGDPQSILINGKGKFNESVGSNEAIDVEPGQTVLFRLINAGVLSYLNVEIEGHNMTVVEADSQPIEPITVTNMDVNIGERYAVLVTMDQPASVYNMTVAIKYRNERIGTASVIYDGASQANVTNVMTSGPVRINGDVPEILDPEVLVSTQQMPQDMLMNDAELVIDGTQEFNEVGELRWPLNGETANPGWLGARESLVPEGELPNTWTYPYGTVLDIVLQNFPAGNGVAEQHPWHLHGHSFYVLGHGPGKFNRTEHKGTLNLANPPLRDMATLYPDGVNNWVAPKYEGEGGIRPSGWVLVRVKLDNPGIWMIHCHVAWHLTMEMLGFIQTEAGLDNALAAVPSGFPQCNKSIDMPNSTYMDDSRAVMSWLPSAKYFLMVSATAALLVATML